MGGGGAGGGGGVWQMLTSSGGRSMLTVADMGRGVKFVKILLTSYVNAPYAKRSYNRGSEDIPVYITSAPGFES